MDAEADPQGAAAVNIAGTAHAASLKVPLDAYSTDYVFDGRKRSPYVESDGPNPATAYGRTKLRRGGRRPQAWVVRTSWLRVDGSNFPDDAPAREEQEVAVVDDQRGCPTYVGHLAEATRTPVDDDLPRGTWHLAADGDCTWADFAEAIFARPDTPRSSADLDRAARAARRSPCVLGSSSGRANAPQLPHWREGLRACLAEMGR